MNKNIFLLISLSLFLILSGCGYVQDAKNDAEQFINNTEQTITETKEQLDSAKQTLDKTVEVINKVDQKLDSITN